MPSLLRFQLYDDPSRKTMTQLQPDASVTDLPAYGYGQSMQLQDEAGEIINYVVADISRIKREPDPDQPGQARVVYEVFLARQEQWERFGEPEEFERIRNGRKIE